MTEFALVGDIGGTNSRFGLVEQGSMAIQHMEALRNDNFPSLEEAIQQYLRNREVTSLSSAALRQGCQGCHAEAGAGAHDDFELGDG